MQMRFEDPIDLVCGDLTRAEQFALWCAVAAMFAIPLAWRFRRAVALDAQQTTWAAVSLLVGVIQVLVVLWRVPLGCLSGHALSTIVGAAMPWLVTAALFRSAVAPAPDAPASRADDPFSSRPPRGPSA